MNIEPIKLGPQKTWPFKGNAAELIVNDAEIKKEAGNARSGKWSEKMGYIRRKLENNRKEIKAKKEEEKPQIQNPNEGKNLDLKNKAGVNFISPKEFANIGENKTEALGAVSNLRLDIFRGGKILGIYKLASLSFDMFLERWKNFLGFFFVIIGVIAFSLLIYKAIPFFPMSDFYKEKVTIGFTLMFAVVSVILKPIIEINIIKLLYDKNLSVLGMIKNSKDRFLHFIATEFLGIFIIIGILISCSVVIGVIYFPFLYLGPKLMAWSSTMIPAINIFNWLFGFLSVLSMLFLLFILHMWVSIAKYSVVLEKMSPMQSIFYGHELIKGKFFSIIKIYFEISAFVVIFFEIAMIHIPMSQFITIFFYSLIIILALISTPLVLLLQFNIFENLKVVKKEEIQKNFDVRDAGNIKILVILGFLSIIFFICFMIFGKNYLIMYKKGIESGKIYNNFGSFERIRTAGEKENIIDENSNKVADHEEEIIKKNKPKLGTMEERDLKRKEDIKAIFLFVYKYKLKEGSVPISPEAVRLNEDNHVVSKIKSVVNKDMPLDPSDPVKYYEYISVDGQTYELTATLENRGDSDCESEIKDACVYKMP